MATTHLLGLEIKSVTVVLGEGVDTILLKTTLPSATFPFLPESGMLRIEAAQGRGLDYCKVNLGIPEEFIAVVRRTLPVPECYRQKPLQSLKSRTPHG